jgi:hypothetical protein
MEDRRDHRFWDHLSSISPRMWLNSMLLSIVEGGRTKVEGGRWKVEGGTRGMKQESFEMKWRENI